MATKTEGSKSENTKKSASAETSKTTAKKSTATADTAKATAKKTSSTADTAKTTKKTAASDASKTTAKKSTASGTASTAAKKSTASASKSSASAQDDTIKTSTASTTAGATGKKKKLTKAQKKKILSFVVSVIVLLVAAYEYWQTQRQEAEAAEALRFPLNRVESAIGTVCSITLHGRSVPAGGQGAYLSDAALLEACFDRLGELEQVFSANLDGAELARLNQTAGTGTAVPVSAELAYVLEKSLDIAQKTDGAFNPSLGALIRLWGIATDDARVPAQKEITAVLPDCRHTNVQMGGDGTATSTVRLGGARTLLDLGGSAKGYAADVLISLLREQGVTSAIIDLGGNIYVLGGKADGSEWRVGVKNPLDPSQVALKVTGKDFTVVTSGVYERYFMQDGVRYHHLLDGKTGYPVQNGLLSVTVLAPTSLESDLLSTALFVLGREKGTAFAKTLPGVTAAFIDENCKVYVCGERAKDIESLDPQFSIIVQE